MEENKFEGLTSSEVSKLTEEKKVNISSSNKSKSIGRILFDNIFTLFNLVNIIIAIAIACVKAWKDLFFIVIIILNTAIAIFQEIYAKKLVDKLTLLNVNKVKVIRDGKEIEIDINNLVLGDIYILQGGMQVPCDSVILSGSIELNESILTGEADTISRNKDENILSGSVVVSGKAYCKITKVGDENYTNKLTKESKKIKKASSHLLQSMKKVTFFSTILIIPLGISLFLEGYFLRNQDVSSLITSTAGSLLGMLPKGLVLLTSVALFSGVIKLSKMKILVHDIYSLESLSHVDVICLDKTGTITTGEMKVNELIKLSKDNKLDYSYIDKQICSYLNYIDDNNQTFIALKDKFILNDNNNNNNNIEEVKFINKLNFSSQRKYSACLLEKVNKYMIIGAYDKLSKNKIPTLEEKLKKGFRVLIIGYVDKIDDIEYIQNNIELIYGVVITDVIRKAAKETINYFYKEGIDVKIISGDNKQTVETIANSVGLQNVKAIDMSEVSYDENNLKELIEIVKEYNIFSRVTPKQKKDIVVALHKLNKKVAMTGDGINDLLALKEADCSISLQSGTQATKQISQLVLLDSNFDNLPNVLLQGRRVVNNVTRSASVFFIKTIYSFFLSIICLCMNVQFPFLPFMITVIDLVCEAFPSFFTIFDKNYNKVDSHFFLKVLKNSVPNAITVTVVIGVMMGIYPLVNLRFEEMRTIVYYCLVMVTMIGVIISFYKFNWYRCLIVGIMVVGFIIGVVFFKSVVSLVPIKEVYLQAIVCLSSTLVLCVLLNVASYLIYRSKVFKKKFYKEEVCK